MWCHSACSEIQNMLFWGGIAYGVFVVLFGSLQFKISFLTPTHLQKSWSLCYITWLCLQRHILCVCVWVRIHLQYTGLNVLLTKCIWVCTCRCIYSMCIEITVFIVCFCFFYSKCYYLYLCSLSVEHKGATLQKCNVKWQTSDLDALIFFKSIQKSSSVV